ncbi:MAG: 1,3-beta-galactosyl-N-acetylhexosamine phosphorylase [Lachnospiraceae bacterium]
MNVKKGRFTIPTDLDVIPETIEMIGRWGADAIRDADGTQFPEALKNTDAKVYATYYTTRKDNEWARANPEEIQQCYILTAFHTAPGDQLRIPLMQGISAELMQPNHRDNISRWWEVIDRTSGTVIPTDQWSYDSETKEVEINHTQPYHSYTVSFLAYLIWDPVHMYNAVINGWDVEHQMTFDVRQPKTHAYSLQRLRRFLESHDYVDVVRFTTFFHQFTLIFDELKREKYVDWYGYSASVSPYILEQFEREAGYPFRPEYIIDAGYYNNQYRVPSKEYLDFMAFQRREVAKLAREFTDITHEYGKEAMMFLGDHWIGTEPYMEEFLGIGVDAVVGSVGNGSTLRLISDIPGAKYKEGRFLPYFFPDTFHPGGDPLVEVKENWRCARRAILRSPLDRIGYGGYLKLALDFPEFIDEVERIADEFRQLYANIAGENPLCVRRIAVLNCWGKMRSWGAHMVHHALYHRQNRAYAGVLEALSGMAVDVSFLSFDDIMAAPEQLEQIDVLLMAGDGDTAHTGGKVWENPALTALLRKYIYNGGGVIGIGEPSGHQFGGAYIQLFAEFGIEKETGLTLGYDKYNWTPQPHFITAGITGEIDFGGRHHEIYALADTQVICASDGEVQLAANSCGKGRTVYISGLPYSAKNTSLLYRAILWASHGEAQVQRWFCDNPNVELNVYQHKYCLVNNTDQPQELNLYDGNGVKKQVSLMPDELKWF